MRPVPCSSCANRNMNLSDTETLPSQVANMTATINSNPSRAGTHTRLALGRGAVKAAFPPALKINKILLPTDFSASSQKALRYAKSFARRFGARLVLLHVVEQVPYTADFGYGTVVRTVSGVILFESCAAHL